MTSTGRQMVWNCFPEGKHKGRDLLFFCSSYRLYFVSVDDSRSKLLIYYLIGDDTQFVFLGRHWMALDKKKMCPRAIIWNGELSQGRAGALRRAWRTTILLFINGWQKILESKNVFRADQLTAPLKKFLKNFWRKKQNGRLVAFAILKLRLPRFPFFFLNSWQPFDMLCVSIHAHSPSVYTTVV